MGFSDPVVGGKTLIREAIQSPNYVAATSGWTINRDGTAEFNSITLRGDLAVGVTPNPRIYIGSAIPAPLVAATADFTWSAAIIEYWNAASFRFDAIGMYVPGAFPARATGTYDSTTGRVMFHEFSQGPGSGLVDAVLYGSDTYNAAQLAWGYRNGFFTLSSTVAASLGGAVSIRGTEVGVAKDYGFGPGPGAAQTTVSATYATLLTSAGGSFALTVPKFSATTNLQITMFGSCFATGATARVGWRALDSASGLNVQCGQLNFFSLLSQSLVSGGVAILSGVPAGSRSILAQWARLSGTGTLNRDSNDWLSMIVEEVGA